jgi:hypothetical protein
VEAFLTVRNLKHRYRLCGVCNACHRMERMNLLKLSMALGGCPPNYRCEGQAAL